MGTIVELFYLYLIKKRIKEVIDFLRQCGKSVSEIKTNPLKKLNSCQSRRRKT